MTDDLEEQARQDERSGYADVERRLSTMPSQSLGWSSLLGMGVVVAGQFAVFLVLGLVVDSAANTSPVFLLVGVLLGVVGSVSYAVVKFRQLLSDQHPTNTPGPSA